MDFTREPMIETIITSKEGCKLVVRSSKSVGQEEYFVEALEVVSFGNGLFFRSLERPKAFLVPASDYEVLEIRETRILLKNVGSDRSIKIGGGRPQDAKGQKEPVKMEGAQLSETITEKVEEETFVETLVEGKIDKKRDRRRNQRRRRGKEEIENEQEKGSEMSVPSVAKKSSLEEPKAEKDSLSSPIQQELTEEFKEKLQTSASVIASLLPPPTTLISETIARYKNDALFKGAFFSKEEPTISLAQEDDLVQEQQQEVIPQELQASLIDQDEQQELHKIRSEKAPYEEEGSLRGTLNEEKKTMTVSLKESETSLEEEMPTPPFDL